MLKWEKDRYDGLCADSVKEWPHAGAGRLCFPAHLIGQTRGDPQGRPWHRETVPPDPGGGIPLPQACSRDLRHGGDRAEQPAPHPGVRSLPAALRHCNGGGVDAGFQGGAGSVQGMRPLRPGRCPMKGIRSLPDWFKLNNLA